MYCVCAGTGVQQGWGSEAVWCLSVCRGQLEWVCRGRVTLQGGCEGGCAVHGCVQEQDCDAVGVCRGDVTLQGVGEGRRVMPGGVQGQGCVAAEGCRGGVQGGWCNR